MRAGAVSTCTAPPDPPSHRHWTLTTLRVGRLLVADLDHGHDGVVSLPEWLCSVKVWNTPESINRSPASPHDPLPASSWKRGHASLSLPEWLCSVKEAYRTAPVVCPPTPCTFQGGLLGHTVTHTWPTATLCTSPSVHC